MFIMSKARPVVTVTLIVIFGVFAFIWGRGDMRRIADIRAEGLPAHAAILDIGYITSRVGGRQWWVTLQWRDVDGSVRTSNKVSVSKDFARSHGGQSRVAIRYLPNQPGKAPMIDVDEEYADQRATAIYQTGHMVIAVFVVGALYLAAMFGAFRHMRRMQV